MPGDGRTLALYMRFQGQYLSALDNKWQVGDGLPGGSGNVKGVIEAGWSFRKPCRRPRAW